MAKSINEITGQIIGAAMQVHSAFGPGLLESAYEGCLVHELESRGFTIGRQIPVPVIYNGVRIGLGYRLDLVVDERVVVEVKAVTTVLPVHKAQLVSYLRLSGYRVGLMINFHELHLKNGITRVVNQLR